MPKLWEALVTMLILVGALALGIVKYETDPHVPMFIGVMGAALMALYLGYKWEAIEKSMMDGIYKALQSVCILVIVGILIGVWINAGVVPTMIFYGLKVLKPAIFFIASVLICSITSLATGTSWGTMGTMGVALMGIGFGLGMSPGMTAGAVLSGAYFGDKMSPLSDTTNLAPAMAGTDVMTHVKAMILPTGITYVITLIGFGILGAMQYHGGDADMSRVTEFSGALEAVFNINPALLLPPVIVIVAVAMKMPAIPGITLGIISGAIMGMIFQPECNMGTVFDFGMNGYYFSDEVLALFRRYSWPGNVRQLENIVEYCVNMAEGSIVQPDDLPPSFLRELEQQPLPALKEAEGSVIRDLLNQYGWDSAGKARAAQALGISVRTLYRKMEQAHLSEK